MKTRLALAALAALGCSRSSAPSVAATAAPAAPLLDQNVVLTPGQPASVDVPVGANEDLVVTVTSEAFDPVLEVVPPGGEPLHNDDYNGSRSLSQLTIHTTQAGPLRLAVSSFGANGTGNYHITVRKVPRETSLGTFITPGQHERGEVRTGDRQLTDRREYDEYMVLGPATGQGYELRLTATGQVVPLAVVLDPSGRSIAQSSPGVFPIREPLLHRIQLITPTPGTTAGYDIALAQVGGAPPAVPGAAAAPSSPGAALAGSAPSQAAVPTAPTAGSVQLPPSLSVPTLTRDHHTLPPILVGRPTPASGNVDGALSARSLRLPSGEWAEVFDIEMPANQLIGVDATSDEFDTYLMVVGPDGTLEENDDTHGTHAHLDLRYASGGHARIAVTSYQSGMSGRFVLKLGASGTGTVAAADEPGETLGVGETTRGELRRGDRTLQSGEFMDTYRETFTPGEHVRIRVAADDFDPYLIVRTPAGQQNDNDDFAPPDRAAGIDIPAAEAGEYSIGITSYQANEQGRYTLQVVRGGGGGGGGGGGTAALPARNSPDPGPSARPSAPGEGQLYGIFVGISDYPEGVGDLDECANDAIKLAEALRNRGLLAADRQVVLTDRQATLSAVRSAFQTLSSRMGTNDTFLFFHSGHGSQEEGSRDTREIDGTDETIVLYDGRLRDDEMGRLYDGVSTRTSLLALDSCFAGGFAKDVITRPGRVGFFSSEEDVESSVASQFQAGGYLSYFLRAGVTGDADIGPRDGVLTVGELQHFLTIQFGRHATDVEMAGAYQHLVVDRGAVRSTEVLWRYR